MAVFMIPCPIVEGEIDQIPPMTIQTLHSLTTFVVERVKTARRFIIRIHHPIPIDQMIFFEFDKHQPENGLYEFLDAHAYNKDIGVLSDAGCPGVADPGSLVTKWAHEHNLSVKPAIGPSSILLALMASGLNGQEFAFHGYLPNKIPQLTQKLKSLSHELRSSPMTHIFIEAPYRNGFLIRQCLQNLDDGIKLCIATDILSPTMEIATMPVRKWKKEDIERFHKKPSVFLVGK
ncbi:MAG TPA: SAM-dependent methyltransferase [Saprospiraceae bacterium]|nr:SAM-dependent methyltransferase [Saprospiraceae bacterium]